MNEVLWMPTVLWGIATGFSLIIILLALGMYLWYQKRTAAVIEDASSVAELAAKREQLEADISQARQWRRDNNEELQKIDAERKLQEMLRQELVNTQMQLVQDEQKVTEARRETSDLQNAVAALSQDRDRIENEKSEFEKATNDAEKKAAVMEQLVQKRRSEMEDVNSELKEKRNELSDINRIVTDLQLRKDSLSDEINNKETNISVLKELLSTQEQSKHEMAEQIDTIKKDLSENVSEYDEAQKEYQLVRDKLYEAENKTRSLEARNAHLKEKSKELSPEATLVDPYEALYVMPDTFTKTGMITAHSNYDEDTALADLDSYLGKCKLSFSPRVIKAFHTSLKISDISPLVVMAGISGTGKSELPRRYAEAMGIHFHLMAVQPRWDSPQDMFGFYNYMEKKYKATELSRSLIQMDKWNNPEKSKYHDRMLLVLLDEMNLARVEYYFSEFLSKLEIRRTVNPDDINERIKAEISLDTGSVVKGVDIPKLYVHKNVLFVGTMNEDESTQTLSDKVIDRANVLRFGRPEKMTSDMPANPDQSDKFLTFTNWKDWQKDYSHLNQQARTDAEKWISTINLALDEIGRPFGYRINQAIFSYIANYPAVNAQNNYRLAFADQLEQRVLPKLRGLEISAKSSCLEKIDEVIEEVGDEALSTAFRKAANPDHTLFTWAGVTRNQEL
ncbi:chromosome partition protein Smc [archaeon BMS3Bbin15]|nr:chromosome partition protein Smc [archaeon BMS3Bbin15]